MGHPFFPATREEKEILKKNLNHILLGRICKAHATMQSGCLRWVPKHEWKVTLMVMVGKDFLNLISLFFFCLNRSWSISPKRIVVLCDDSITLEEVVTLTGWIPGIEVLGVNQIYSHLEEVGKLGIIDAKRHAPAVKMVDKLALLCAFDGQRRVYCDLDILWKTCPFRQIHTEDRIAMAEDIKHSYDLAGFPDLDCMRLKMSRALNAGFIYLAEDWYQLAEIDLLIDAKNQAGWNHFSEQTLMSMSLYRLEAMKQRVNILKRPWMTFGNEGPKMKNDSRTICVHYTAGSRWDIFPDGLKAVAQVYPFKTLLALVTP